jgi:hypothetical protein
MRKRPLLVFVVAVLGAGVVWAAQLGPVQVQSDQSMTVSAGGQTLDITTIDVAVAVEFDLVSSSLVRGSVQRIGGTTGTCRIFWREQSKERLIPIVGGEEEEFSLEGGDTDKKSGGQMN